MHYFKSANCGHLHSAARGNLAVPLSRTMRYGQMFCYSWSKTLEFTPIVCWWSITDTDSVLCTSEDCVILQSIRNKKH